MVVQIADRLRRPSCGFAVAIVSLAGDAARASYEIATIKEDAFVSIGTIYSIRRQKGNIQLRAASYERTSAPELRKTRNLPKGDSQTFVTAVTFKTYLLCRSIIDIINTHHSVYTLSKWPSREGGFQLECCFHAILDRD